MPDCSKHPFAAGRLIIFFLQTVQCPMQRRRHSNVAAQQRNDSLFSLWRLILGCLSLRKPMADARVDICECVPLEAPTFSIFYCGCKQPNLSTRVSFAKVSTNCVSCCNLCLFFDSYNYFYVSLRQKMRCIWVVRPKVCAEPQLRIIGTKAGYFFVLCRKWW